MAATASGLQIGNASGDGIWEWKFPNWPCAVKCSSPKNKKKFVFKKLLFGDGGGGQGAAVQENEFLLKLFKNYVHM